MTALLLKDFYTLLKQSRIFLLIIVLFAVIPGYAISTMAVVYAAMLPVTALAYDERSKWDNLAAMMPYSVKSIVLGKYVIGYFSIAGVSILSTVAQFVLSAVKNTSVDPKMPISLLLTVCVSLIMLSVNLPVMFRFGVEKGRIAFLVLFGVIGAFVMAMNEKLDTLLMSVTNNPGIVTVSLVGATIVLSIVSVCVSVVWYKRRFI